MATIRAPPLPASYTAPSSSSKITPNVKRRILPAGQAFLTHLRLTLHHEGSFLKHDHHMSEEREREQAAAGSSNGVEDDLGVGDEPETAELLALDPKEWKVR